MNEPLEEQTFGCPYCASENSLMADISGGLHQTFTTDCETCCRPILITLSLEEDSTAHITVERES